MQRFLQRSLRVLILGGLAALSLAVAAPLRAQTAPPALPPGEGRDLVAVACTQCHGLTTIVQMRDGAGGWRQFVNYMIMKGAQVSNSEAETVVQYLTANFGPNSPPAAGA